MLAIAKHFQTCCLGIALVWLSACATDNDYLDKGAAKPQENTVYALPGLDHGLIQSPINILSTRINDRGQHKITLHFNDHFRAAENLGHTVQMDFTPGGFIESDGQSYAFKQLHFHTPSEHLIDGVTFPMEMHIVSYLPPKAEEELPHYLVIAVLFKMGEANRFIQEVLDSVPPNAHETRYIKHDSVHLKDLFIGTINQEFNDFYHYRGSLTTPPYTESVQWFVLKQIIEASPEQIEAINIIEGNNARHIQASRGRTVD
ncbi:MAG: hypothetical protein Kow0060_18670 [Methylohalobius crimeensis]